MEEKATIYGDTCIVCRKCFGVFGKNTTPQHTHMKRLVQTGLCGTPSYPKIYTTGAKRREYLKYKQVSKEIKKDPSRTEDEKKKMLKYLFCAMILKPRDDKLDHYS
jgi:hypothetical protein